MSPVILTSSSRPARVKMTSKVMATCSRSPRPADLCTRERGRAGVHLRRSIVRWASTRCRAPPQGKRSPRATSCRASRPSRTWRVNRNSSCIASTCAAVCAAPVAACSTCLDRRPKSATRTTRRTEAVVEGGCPAAVVDPSPSAPRGWTASWGTSGEGGRTSGAQGDGRPAVPASGP